MLGRQEHHGWMKVFLPQLLSKAIMRQSAHWSLIG